MVVIEEEKGGKRRGKAVEVVVVVEVEPLFGVLALVDFLAVT